MLDIVELTHLGQPRKTGESIPCQQAELKEVLDWHGVIGIAEDTYPHPKGWTFLELARPTNLLDMQVKHLTEAFRMKSTRPPNCEKAWSTRLEPLMKAPISWREVWGRLYHPAATPRDYKAHF